MFFSCCGKTAVVYRNRHLEINEMTDITPEADVFGVHYADDVPVFDGEKWLQKVDEWLYGQTTAIRVGPGQKGFPGPTEGGYTCSLDGYERILSAQDLAYQGRWSKGAKMRFRKCCDILFQGAITTWEKHPSKETRFPFQVAFLTLTIPNSAGYVNPKDGHKKLLEPYLRWLRRKGVNGYVWVREFKKQGGQLHYHMVYDKFILKTELMRYWNHLMKKAGYLDAYFGQYGHYDSPSTRVDKAQNPEQCIYYMEKYMTKALQDNDRLEDGALDDGVDRKGKLWDASRNLKEGKPFRIEMTPEIEANLHQKVHEGTADMKIVEGATLYFAKKGSFLKLMPHKIQQLALWHYRAILYVEMPVAFTPT